MSLWSETRGSGPDLVLLHGWGLSSAIWGDFADRLAESYRVTLIDLPGLGHSAATDDMSLDAVVASLLATAPESAHWLGWSLGGQLALAAAEQAPERVKSLSLIAANPVSWPVMAGPVPWHLKCSTLSSSRWSTMRPRRCNALPLCRRAVGRGT